MSRPQSIQWFRTSFEQLEPRQMMAADAGFLSIRAFLASGGTSNTTLQPTKPTTSPTQGGSTAPITSPTSPTSNTTTPTPAPTPAPTPPVVVPDWFGSNLVDTALRDLTRSIATDGTLNRSDMLGIFRQVEKDGVVSGNEFTDLKKLIGNSTFFVGYDYVRVLSTYVVAGNPANAQFQGQKLGNLTAGWSASQFDKLVQKWFLGADHPVAMAGTTYKQATASLFTHTPTYSDIIQGSVGDCYLLASLGEAAIRDPNSITSMFIVNGDGTYTVRLYNNGQADYVTVDSMLPVTSYGTYVYANMGQNISNRNVPLWVALAEKAYVQMNESGWLRASFGQNGTNRYDAISGGYMTDTLRQVTGRNATFNIVGQSTFEAAWNSGSLITFGSTAQPYDSTILKNHGYAVVGYNAVTKLVTLFNPWGVNNRYSPGLVTVSWAQMSRDFFAMQYTV